MSFQVIETKGFTSDAVKDLFDSVGWESHISGENLMAAMRASTHVLAAFKDNKLIGLIRDLDDGIYNANIDCLVVHKDYQHIGVGTALVKAMLSKLSVMHYITVAVNEPENVSFYQQFGFEVLNGGVMQICQTPIFGTCWDTYREQMQRKFTRVF